MAHLSRRFAGFRFALDRELTRRGLARTLVVCTLLVASSVVRAETPGDLVTKEIAGTYEDVRAQLVFAIEERGLNVTNVADIGQMLERTGKDFGVMTPVYRHASVVQFCSARLSHGAAGADPRAIALCPISIAVYELTAAPERVQIVFRRMNVGGISGALADVFRQAEKLVAEIVESAAE